MSRLGGPRILGLFRGRRRGFGWSGGVLVGDGKEGGTYTRINDGNPEFRAPGLIPSPLKVFTRHLSFSLFSSLHFTAQLSSLFPRLYVHSTTIDDEDERRKETEERLLKID